MAKLIQAPRTNRIVSFARNVLGDIGHEIFKTDDEIFEQANIAQEEIARETYCLTTPDLKTALVPDRWEYDLIALIDSAQYILRVDRISILDPNNVESKPLTKVDQTFFTNARLSSDYSVPTYYDFDGRRLYIWKPYTTTGYQILIRCARFPSVAELINYVNDPVVDTKYDVPLMHGTVAKLILTRKDLTEKFNAEYYLAEFNKYKDVKIKRKNTESNFHYSNPLNL